MGAREVDEGVGQGRLRQRSGRLAVTDPEPTSGGASRVLVIDDDPAFCDLMAMCLRKAGYEPLQAFDGEQGLEVAARTRPDAIIVDAALPGIDGIGVLHRIRLDAGLHRTPCLMLTGSDSRDNELRALDAGADAYVRKSERMSVVMARLRAVIRATSGPSLADSTTSILSPKRVLVLEHALDAPALPLAELRRCGYEFHTLRRPDEAFAWLRKESVDCILVLLSRDGPEEAALCHRFKNSVVSRDVPLVVMLADDRPETMIGMLNAGADDCIGPSMPTSMVKARIAAQIRRKQQEDVARSIQQELLLREKEAQAAQAMAEARAAHLAELEQKNRELQEMNRELERARKKAKQESQYKSKFLASMSHELRTPLNAIIGFSELLEQEIGGPLTPVQADYVQNVLSSGRHLLTLINDVLDLSKIEAGMMTLHREWAELPPLVDAVLKVVRPLAEQRGLALETEIESTLPELYVDVVRIKQVLYNLLSNAIKFTDEGGRVRVTARATDSHVEVTVRDTGVGIDPQDIPLLFREFVQIDGVQGDRPAGTGLGLPLTKNLVELHGGSMRVESRPGEGSAFTFVLPHLRRQDAEGEADGDASVAASHDRLPREVLALVCDDDPKSAELIAGQLRALGLSVIFARSAQEAIRAAYEVQPAVITLDISMPEFDGWATLARLKANPETASIPVVVVSVVEVQQRGMHRGAADCLVKPVDHDKLATCLEVIGVRLRRLDGLSILVAGPRSNELETIAGHLRHARATVTRVASVGAEAIRAAADFDLVLLDLWSASEPGTARQAEEAAARHRVAAIGVTASRPPADMRTCMTLLGRDDALQADLLVRAVYRAAVRHGRKVSGRLALQSREEQLEQRLGRMIAMVAREDRPLAVVGLRVAIPAHMEPVAVRSLLEAELRTEDVVEQTGPERFVCVTVGVQPRDVASLRRRLAAVCRRQLGIEVLRAAVAHYPRDGAQAAALLANVESQLESGRSQP